MAQKKAGKAGGEPKERRRKYGSPEELEKKIDAYFDDCDLEGRLYGEAGLARYLGVILVTARKWCDGTDCPDLQFPMQMAYLRMQEQIESDPRYREKGMVTRGIFLNKQPRFGGYQDRIEARQDIAVNVKMGDGMDASDFQ